MKRQLRALCLLLALSTLTTLFKAPVSAQQVTSPSVRAAARLKHNPPRNWIRHYLPDDRYKIAGGVWKVVSTELDRYYYPAWAPEMMRQKPGIVIGFASIAEAEEAGYLPSAYPMGESLYGLTPAEIAAAKRRAAASPAQLGTRITLSDGRSTVILPRGWKHTRAGSQSQSTAAGTMSYQADMLSPSNGRTGIMFVFMNMPGNRNVESFLSPEKVEEFRTQMQQYGGASEALKGAQIGHGSLGGLRGLTIVPGAGAKLPAGMAGRLTMVGRGSKLYIMAGQLSTKDTNYGTIVNSFQPR